MSTRYRRTSEMPSPASWAGSVMGAGWGRGTVITVEPPLLRVFEQSESAKTRVTHPQQGCRSFVSLMKA